MKNDSVKNYKRNFLFPLNNDSKCEWNISAYCSQMMALLGWKSLYAWYYPYEISSRRRRERKNAHVCVCVHVCVCFK